DLLAETLAHVANHARKTAEHETDRQHAHAHDAFLQLAHIALELSETGTQMLRHGARYLRAELAQHRLRDHELADGIHELIDLLGAHSHRCAVGHAVFWSFLMLMLRCRLRRLRVFGRRYL